MDRCSWVSDDPLYQEYHDHEWGKPVYDDQKLYEMFLLETFQAGLSWITILHKREAFKEAFDQFDVNKIAMYDDCKINELMNNPKIIRNSRKIKAAVKNAQIFIEIQKEYGSFSKYLWAYTNDKIIYEKKENQNQHRVASCAFICFALCGSGGWMEAVSLLCRLLKRS